MIRKRVRKRHIAIGLVALELASIPVAAQMVDHVSFKVEPRVIVAEVPDRPAGERTFLVASNAAFVIEVEDVVGPVRTAVTPTGQVDNLSYGNAAELPGLAGSCISAQGNRTQVYAATGKTAKLRGKVQDQAVRIDVRFDPIANPLIHIVPRDEGSGLPGGACGLS